MAKNHPSLRNQKNRKSRKNPSHNSLPPEILAKGIATQKELVMALLPYMEWVRYETLRDVFWKYVSTHRSDNPLRGYLCQLANDGLIERKYEGQPTAIHGSPIKLSGYLYVRRISRDMQRKVSGGARELKLKGMFGFESEKKRAAQAKRGKKKPPKAAVKNLALDDFHYIRGNPNNMNTVQLSEMFNLTKGMTGKIRKGYVPEHLRGQLVQ